jgi:Peptidase family M28
MMMSNYGSDRRRKTTGRKCLRGRWRTLTSVAILTMGFGSLRPFSGAQTAQQEPSPQAGARAAFGLGGLGLPADRDKLYQPDKNYIQVPLPPGDQRYAGIKAGDIEKIQSDVIAISEKSKADGNQYWGRITGTEYDHMTSDYVMAAFKKLGLEQVREQELDLPPQWMAKSWKVSLEAGGETIPLTSAYPFQNSVGTADGGVVENDVVWVGMGTAADFAGRDVKGKAVFIYSWPTPGGRDSTAFGDGALKRAQDAGAASIFMVLAFPGNAQGINSQFASKVPGIQLGKNDGNAVREAVEKGEKPKVQISLDIQIVPNLKTHNTWGVLPGETKENIMIMAHHDGYFDAALDNASGTALMLTIARYYAGLPKSQRRRTITFLDTSGHHSSPDVGARWINANMKDYLANTVFIANCEHTSQTQIYYINDGMETSDAIDARRWFVSGSDAFKKMVEDTFREFGVALYTVPEASPGGELSQFARAAPSFHIIDHIFYHTSLDTQDWTPGPGQEAVARAYLKILDSSMKFSAAEIKGPNFPPPSLGRRGSD